ncbi:MAG: F0F1 ATP synthase subunit A [Armatimonadetes bacterium]|nr:F0F1 ATP synthase subunit A [Armatimonadota bacterium]
MHGEAAGHGAGLEHGTWLHFLYTYHILPDWIPEAVPVTWLVIIILSVMAILSTRGMNRVPGGLQNAMEWVYSALEGFTRNIIGEKGPMFTPIIGTVFIFILSMNLFGLIPGFISPTANINTTVALALAAFVIVQYFGAREAGLKNYVMHFVGEPIWLAPLMLPLHIIGELARPLSLSIRLFGNIFGEDMVIAILILIVVQVLGNLLIPIQFPMLLFAVFTSFVQALVFSMLVSIYIAVALGDHHEHAHQTEGGES